MHKSKLAGFIIDCKTDDLEGAAAFWSAALGMKTRALPGVEGENYIRLLDEEDRLHIEVQAVTHESRVHLDIAADDVEAEVKRLEELGAKRVAKVQRLGRNGSPDRTAILRGARPQRKIHEDGENLEVTGAGRLVREGLLHPGSRRGPARDLGRCLGDRARLGDAERTRSDRRRADRPHRVRRAGTDRNLPADRARRRRTPSRSSTGAAKRRQCSSSITSPSRNCVACASCCPRTRLVQVIHVVGPESVDEAQAAAALVDTLLLDSGNPRLAVKELGGTGRVHDWEHSRRIRDNVSVPVLLAGGLHPGNARAAMEQVEPAGLDVCSGLRLNGRLDAGKLRDFFSALH